MIKKVINALRTSTVVSVETAFDTNGHVKILREYIFLYYRCVNNDR